MKIFEIQEAIFVSVFRARAQEVTVIRKSEPIHLIVYFPKTEEGKEELSRRVAEVHANAVNARLKALNCPTSQKLELLDAVIDTAKKRIREQNDDPAPGCCHGTRARQAHIKQGVEPLAEPASEVGLG